MTLQRGRRTSEKEQVRPTAGQGPAGPELSHQLRQDAARNLARVLAAARQVFDECGTAFSVEEVAVRAGVGVGTIYRRFPTKGDLLDAVALPLHQQTLELARKSLEMPAGDGLERFVREATAFHAAHGLPARLLWGAAGAASVRQDIRAAMEVLIQGAKEVGALREDVGYQDVVVL